MFLFCSFGVKRNPCRPRRCPAAKSSRSGDDVGGDLVFDESDTVAQRQLALLQPLQPQQVGGGRLMQCIDRRIEISVFLLQPGELGFEFARVFMGHAWPKTDRLEIKAVDVLWKLSSLRGVIASDLERAHRSPARYFGGTF